VIERRHRVECVRQRAETEPDREHTLAMTRGRVPGRADDALIEEHPRDFSDVVHLGRHRDHHQRAAADLDHLVRAVERRRDDPIAAMDAAELRIEKRSFEVHAQAARAGIVARFLELIRRFGDLRRGVHHRFPRRGHHGGDVTGRTHARVRARRDVDRIALIAVEEHVFGAVGMDVDQARCEDRAGRRCEIARTLALEHLGDASVFDRDPSVDARAIPARYVRRAENVGSIRH